MRGRADEDVSEIDGGEMSIELPHEIPNIESLQPLDSESMKHYTEELALAVLRYCFDEYDNFLVKDAPDLQSPDYSIGIEVTEIAVSKNKAIDGDYLQYRKTKDDKYLVKIREKGGTATDMNYGVLPVTKDDELEAMKNVFRKKLKKIPEYKSKGFGVLGLVMVMNEIPIPYTAYEWGEMIYGLNSSSDNKYDRIFFTYRSTLSILDCTTGKVEFKPIAEKDYNALCAYARMKVENTN